MALGDWQDGEAGGTPLSAARLNERDTEIQSAQSAASDAATTAEWASVSGKPSTFPPTIGATADTAAAGNHTHADLATAAALAALEARVTALETP